MEPTKSSEAKIKPKISSLAINSQYTTSNQNEDDSPSTSQERKSPDNQ
jgi:hypothetical protein